MAVEDAWFRVVRVRAGKSKVEGLFATYEAAAAVRKQLNEKELRERPKSDTYWYVKSTGYKGMKPGKPSAPLQDELASRPGRAGAVTIKREKRKGIKCL